MLNCWTDERKNGETKQAMTNQNVMELVPRTTLSRSLNEQIRKLATPGWSSTLEGKQHSCEELGAGAMVARGVRHKGMSLRHDRPALLGDGHDDHILIVVAAGTCTNGNFGVLYRRCALLSRHHEARSSTWAVAPEIEHMAIEHLWRTPQCWRWVGHEEGQQRIEILYL